ncbi:response regulator PleD [Kiloniella litopenaei]|uniref:diguanylate cyclase n=1 Tax=Kiloniella litopenaei TaxID=1549748 RepID=A0A0M2R9H2_9PROT|nr:PleD family two-component system response regulator [Kiloniella litopenaei]KKJ76625.1 response regulator PleD [Kiloniella litopenaei]
MAARILVVDDIPANVRLLEAKLMAEYFEVITASDGQSALEIAAKEMPDIILLDVMMPGMDGYEVCSRLKSDPKMRHIPVVMVTALSEVSDRVRGLEVGADDFLTKPLNDVALFARVRSLVRLKMMTDELRVRQEASSRFESIGSGVSDEDEAISNANILLAETNDLAASKIINFLTELEHNVDHCRNPREVIELGQEKSYDLFIVALDLGGEDGLRLCSQLRAHEETRHVPILLVLEEENLSQLAKGLDIGVTDYLVKPIDPNELRARCKTQIKRRRYHDRLTDMLKKSVAMAYTDPLTGVFNRRYMNAHLDRAIMEIAETAKPVSTLMFDIDHFKKVNDTYGHASGDEVLKVLAKRVADAIRDFDMLARYGGEEFVVIMPSASSEQAFTVAERLRRRVGDKPIEVPGSEDPLTITISVGVATTSDPMEMADSLLARADTALYDAKSMGRNCVCIEHSSKNPAGGHTVTV